jgi:N-acetylglucosaminyldiphosphoundecaprenol N-acetyl-beta-D-mannosaminyltransferase
MNTYGVVTFIKNEKYAEIIEKADIVYADGCGPILASRFSKNKLSIRVNVGDYIDKLFNSIQRYQLTIYLLGGQTRLLKKTISVIKKKYPLIRISGYHHGFFSKESNFEIIKNIKKGHPNIVLVGMGLPIQEFWINDNWEFLPDAVYLGVGGVFEYIAGKIRAPLWMRNNCLEWLYRFFQEPKRLWRRYTLDNISFIYTFIKHLTKNNNCRAG